MNEFKILDKRDRNFESSKNFESYKNNIKGILLTSLYLLFLFIYIIINLNYYKVVENELGFDMFIFLLLMLSSFESLVSFVVLALIPIMIFYLGRELK